MVPDPPWSPERVMGNNTQRFKDVTRRSPFLPNWPRTSAKRLRFLHRGQEFHTRLIKENLGLLLVKLPRTKSTQHISSGR